jgi:hypothetical protein
MPGPATFPEIAPAVLTGGEATYYTVTTAKIARHIEIMLCNTHTAAVTVTLWVVASGGAAALASRIYDDSIPSKKSIPISIAVNLGAGGTLRGMASTSNVVGMRVAPVEIPST